MKTIRRALGMAVLGLVGCQAGDGTPETDRQEEVAAVGATVMPFDLDATTHVFEKTEEGGLQQVLADEAGSDQVELIREHLRTEAVRFAAGDFHSPEMIHGADMPGLHDLVTGHERLVVEYDDIEDGGQIRYSTDDAALIAALHAWFDAQLSDHGAHAQAHR